ncbi:flippase-like domain-containing protein [Microbacterium sp. CFH 90308]|uniref:Flippase-like domain-containing protein n=1 Tax=Microbacterium salsuginis TaxID=2722803 RepID=A0ABX1KD75_9MICO|nr:lysylphosphatidylglycerol synthase transmembrane domain-containing protein [Microbacterium sp. CFH 90308]NLP83361.1 flippase-like domain-containing protein [Microbacterium sp. CFH 90308]
MSAAIPHSGRAVRPAARWQPWARAAAGLAILAAILAVTGAEPFLRGIASVSAPAIAAAALLAAAATAAAAWRWRVLAGRLGLRLGWGQSVAAYYRSQFLNTVLPGGVVGDVERAITHGRRLDRVAQATRAVVAERTAGQVVQLALAIVVVAAIGFAAYAPAMAVLLGSLGVVVALAAIGMLSGRVRRAVVRELGILREAFRTVGTVLAVVAASVIVVTAHVLTFVVACAATGVVASPEQMTLAAIAAVLASSLPLGIGGWGPREGAAAWAFSAVGLGATAGITAATAYGVLVMIALAPGALIVAASLLRRRHVPTDAGRRATT